MERRGEGYETRLLLLASVCVRERAAVGFCHSDRESERGYYNIKLKAVFL